LLNEQFQNTGPVPQVLSQEISGAGEQTGEEEGEKQSARMVSWAGSLILLVSTASHELIDQAGNCCLNSELIDETKNPGLELGTNLPTELVNAVRELACNSEAVESGKQSVDEEEEIEKDPMTNSSALVSATHQPALSDLDAFATCNARLDNNVVVKREFQEEREIVPMLGPSSDISVPARVAQLPGSEASSSLVNSSLGEPLLIATPENPTWKEELKVVEFPIKINERTAWSGLPKQGLVRMDDQQVLLKLWNPKTPENIFLFPILTASVEIFYLFEHTVTGLITNIVLFTEDRGVTILEIGATSSNEMKLLYQFCQSNKFNELSLSDYNELMGYNAAAS
jgi:hypothetical protein